MTSIYRALFSGVSFLGRPFGGIPPRRITYWLGDRAYGQRYQPTAYRWQRDRWGLELRLNPFYFVDRLIIAFGTYDMPLHRCIERRIRPGMVCFDVGANIGTMTLHMAKCCGSTGQVHSFEPVPKVRARLEENVRRNNLQDVVRVRPIALSDRDGTMTMAVAPETTQNQGMGSLVHREEGVTDQVQVPLTTIDAYVAEHGIERIDFIKVDIQGAEPLLLAGGRRVFSTLSPDLVMELSPADLAGAGYTPAKLVRMIEDYGYRVYELDHDGAPARQLMSRDMADHHAAENVLCTKKPM